MSPSASVLSVSMVQSRSSVPGTGSVGEMLTLGAVGGELSMVTGSEVIGSPESVPSEGVTVQVTSSPLAKWSLVRVASLTPGSVLSTAQA